MGFSGLILVVLEPFGVVGPGGLDLVEGHRGALLEGRGERFEAVEAVLYCRHFDRDLRR